MTPTRRLLLGSALMGLIVAASLVVRTRQGWDRTDLEKLEHGCDQGRAVQCNTLGVHYFYGTGVEKDEARAQELFRRACNRGLNLGCTMGAVVQLDGSAAFRNEPAAARTFDALCASGELFACSRLSMLLFSGRAVAANPERAMWLLERACEGGQWDDCVTLGWRLTVPPEGQRSDLRRAAKLFQDGCNHSNTLGCRRLAEAQACGRGIERDVVAARSQFERLCTKGDFISCDALAAGALHMPEVAKASTPEVRLAAAILGVQSGRPSRAEELLGSLDAGHSHGVGGAFLSACVDVEEGRLDSAALRAAALRSDAGSEPALVVLEKLIELRREAVLSWPDAVYSAWAASGAPDLRRSRFLPGSYDANPGFCSWSVEVPVPQSLDTVEQFLGVFSKQKANSIDRTAIPDTLVDAAVRFSSGAPQTQLVSFSVLTQRSLSAEQRRRTRAVVSRIRVRRLEQHPKDLFSALLVVAPEVGSPCSLGPTGIEVLEEVASSPYKPPHREVFEAFKAAFIRGGDPAPATNAFNQTIAVFESIPFMKLASCLEAGAAADPQSSKRIGRLLVTLGQSVSAGGWLWEVFEGAYLQRVGARLTGEPADQKIAAATLARGQRFYRGEGVFPGLGQWPLHAFSEEMAEENADAEMTHYEHLDALIKREAAK